MKLTKQQTAFVADLKALCRKHKTSIVLDHNMIQGAGLKMIHVTAHEVMLVETKAHDNITLV